MQGVVTGVGALEEAGEGEGAVGGREGFVVEGGRHAGAFGENEVELG